MSQSRITIRYNNQFQKQQLVLDLPDTLLVGLIMRSYVVHFALGDYTQVNVAARAQVIKDTCGDAISNQLLSLLLLQRNNRNAQMKTSMLLQAAIFSQFRVLNSLQDHMLCCFELQVSGVLTSISGLQRSSKTAIAARDPEPFEKRRAAQAITDLTLFMCSACQNKRPP